MADKVKTVKEFINRERCECKKIATYYYMPSYTGKKEEDNYFCEDCVPRGCSCEWTYASKDAYGPEPLAEDFLPDGIEGVDWKWIVRAADEDYEEIKSGEIWVYTDKQGREYPCVEYWYSEDGWDKE
jgi:hypothetical protein